MGFWKRVVFCVLYAVFVLLLVELASRAYLCIRKGTPFLSPGAITYAFYPELETVKRERIKKGDEYFDILILGGSVVNDDWGNIGETLREKLENKTGKKVRIHNVSASAHNSLDSYYKYGYLADKEFDSVLFYHAINEVQANNC
ncbi:MAG: hypothetical protein U9Q21_03680, partial [Candidatus Auribacterota bacterium]|nr:hypothetical protein [Candidatus Auribacterota bacterium]